MEELLSYPGLTSTSEKMKLIFSGLKFNEDILRQDFCGLTYNNDFLKLDYSGIGVDKAELGSFILIITRINV